MLSPAPSGVAASRSSFGGAVGAFVLTAGPAAADTINVTNTADDGSATSLRGVLESVNDGDIVVLTAGATYQLTICEEPIDTPESLEGTPGWGDIEINGSVTIVGGRRDDRADVRRPRRSTRRTRSRSRTSPSPVVVKGPGGGLFQDSASPVTLTGVTFTGNESSSGGGGVATSGDVTVTGSTFSDNHATGGSGDGGGIQVLSDVATVTIDGSTFSGNTADGWGGAFEQEGREVESGATGVFELHVTNSSIVDNTAESDGGGGIDTEDDSTMTIDHSTLSGNEGGLAGAVGNFADSSFTANASTFSGNTSHGAGGAVLGGGTYSFVNSTITGNTESGFGALNVEELTLLHVTMTDNTTLGEGETEPLASRGLGALAVEDDAANIVTGRSPRPTPWSPSRTAR